MCAGHAPTISGSCRDRPQAGGSAPGRTRSEGSPLRPFPVNLSIGCQLQLHCESATPLLALVHPHTSLVSDLVTPERLDLDPDRTF